MDQLTRSQFDSIVTYLHNNQNMYSLYGTEAGLKQIIGHFSTGVIYEALVGFLNELSYFVDEDLQVPANLRNNLICAACHQYIISINEFERNNFLAGVGCSL